MGLKNQQVTQVAAESREIDVDHYLEFGIGDEDGEDPEEAWERRLAWMYEG